MTPRVAPEAISIQAAAQILTVSQDTIRRHIKRGDLEAVRIGKLWRIPKSAIADLRRRRDEGDAMFERFTADEAVRPLFDREASRFAADLAQLVALILLEESATLIAQKDAQDLLRDPGRMAIPAGT